MSPYEFFLISMMGAILLQPASSNELFHDFEQNAEGWSSSAGGTIRLSEKHAKSGIRALEWSWNSPRAKLSVRFPAQRTGKHRNHETHLGLWLYNERPVRERLHVHAYSGERKVCSFWFNLDYEGWRALGANYMTLKVPERTTVDRVVFHAPPAAGKLWLDAFKPAFMSFPVKADDRQPWADNPAMLEAPPKKTFYSPHDIGRNRNYLPPLCSVRKNPAEGEG